MMYLATAYRWGWVNNHLYHVYAGADRTKALAMAEAEVYERGGKYGCAVYAFNEDGTDYTLEGYFPSTYDEKEPYHNDRIDMFERLGHVFYNYSKGIAYLPDPEKEGFLAPVKVDPPEWVITEVKRAEEFTETMVVCRTRSEEAITNAP